MKETVRVLRSLLAWDRKAAMTVVLAVFAWVFDDRGVGITEDEVPQIFGPFYRAATARDVPGAGLGLASATTIVEQHGGQISVASALGVGTTVVVVLPPPGQRPAPRRAPGAWTQEVTERQGRSGKPPGDDLPYRRRGGPPRARGDRRARHILARQALCVPPATARDASRVRRVGS